jgi:hypothetical protein
VPLKFLASFLPSVALSLYQPGAEHHWQYYTAGLLLFLQHSQGVGAHAINTAPCNGGTMGSRLELPLLMLPLEADLLHCAATCASCKLLLMLLLRLLPVHIDGR